MFLTKRLQLFTLILFAGILTYCAGNSPKEVVTAPDDWKTDGRNPSDWEKLPEATITYDAASFTLSVYNGEKSEKITTSLKNMVDNNITISPQDGSFIKLMDTPAGNYKTLIIWNIKKTSNDDLIDNEAAVESHIYLDGKYIDSGYDSRVNTEAHAPRVDLNPLSHDIIQNMKSGQVLKIIFDFTAKDGTHYKWTSPNISFK